MKRKKYVFPVVMTLIVLMLSACEDDEYVLNIEKGEFVVLEDPYQHPYASDITIKAVILVEVDSLPHRGRIITPYCISGHIPTGFAAGDTTLVKATIKEIYPKGITITEVSNVTVYKLIKIERI